LSGLCFKNQKKLRIFPLYFRLSDENTCGVSALLQRKTMSALYPQIGHVFANLPTSGTSASRKESEQGGANDSLLINVIEEGNAMLEHLRILNLKPQVSRVLSDRVVELDRSKDCNRHNFTNSILTYVGSIFTQKPNNNCVCAYNNSNFSPPGLLS
jgi:hypothetical protein